MSNTATVITTKVGEALIAQMQAENKVLVIDKFIFANVPNRPAFPNRDDVVPVEHVVHESAVHEQGRLTENSVIYSTTLASNVGPFSFNWSGLFCSEHNVLVAINFPPPVDKTVDAPGITGNTLVRSFVLEYKGISETTNITVDPSSWQYDAHKRMSKMDNDTAQAIIDQNGKDWFIDDGFIVTPQSGAYSIKAGAGYVSGHRISLDFDRIIQVPEKPAFIYVDAFREGSPTGEWQTKFTFVVAAVEKDDYTDGQGVNHFVCKIAQVFEDGSVSMLRKKDKVGHYVDSINNLHTTRDAIEWRPNLKVKTKDALQLFSHTDEHGVKSYYLPNLDNLPFATGDSWLEDINKGYWNNDKTVTQISYWKSIGDIRGWMPINKYTKNDFFDSSPFIRNAVNESDVIIIPKCCYIYMGEYVSLRDNMDIIIDGTIVQLQKQSIISPQYHEGGFDAERKENITIKGTGYIHSQGFLSQDSDGFKIHQGQGYCPPIHLRACKNVKVDGLNFYKGTMGVACTIFDKASYEHWDDMGSLSPSYCENNIVTNCKFKYLSFFAATLNTVRKGGINNCYAYRCGDSGIHIQFCKDVAVTDNTRESPYGDGGLYGDGIDGILSKNDCQGMSIENCQDSIVKGNVIVGLCTNGIDIKNNCVNILVTGNVIKHSQLSAISVRGGDVVYGINTAITITNNQILKTGYKHTLDSVWVNHPFKGAIYVDDTYTCFIKGNTITGHNSLYAGEPIRCSGVRLGDLGFWSAKPVIERVSYTKLVINGNTISFSQFRSNYPDITESFESNDCNLSGIYIGGATRGADLKEGIWGDIQVNDNQILSNGFHSLYSLYEGIAGISISPQGGSDAGVSACQSLCVSGNVISYWPGVGIFVNGDNFGYEPPMAVNISNNVISNTSGGGIVCKNLESVLVDSNKLTNICRINENINKYGVMFSSVILSTVVGNSIRSAIGHGVNTYTHTLWVEDSSIYLSSNLLDHGTGDLVGGNYSPQWVGATETNSFGVNVVMSKQK
ncbi:phage tail-collar fiber domain-containing protein [Photobacterium iliopiscarium]|uniref:phage tail-collar fiber domain-containing protein n=1 Tax=Photobacterium iliopiscarium TaxID=56192 RepID=UPI0015E6F5D2|nr:phage tail protein [Photobacterium iliopiscarium]